jgi:hypothetical protein
VIVLAYPPYTFHIVQMLDVLLFEVLRRAKKNQDGDDERRAQVDHFLGLFYAYEQAITSATVRPSWVKTGF